jgi:hypothetical protein
LLLVAAGFVGVFTYAVGGWALANADHEQRSRNYRLNRPGGSVRVHTLRMADDLLRVVIEGTFDNGDALLGARTELADFGCLYGKQQPWCHVASDIGRSRIERQGEALPKGSFSFQHLCYCQPQPAEALLDRLCQAAPPAHSGD